MNSKINIAINEAKNIGPTIAKRLNEIGIYCLTDLAKVTPVNAYKQMVEKNDKKRLPICYYLYSLEGALLDLNWDDIPKELKLELKKQIGN
ncbi:TfoX/Sxy family DNA transformation protein [Aureibaculum conchae]|uniref:TfoX/Sxy family DNA transformation protein n=1 Tax=Aureibaculum sp. 2308TA14-22 TaxID=3108392 RepID=UPI00339B1D9F